MTIRQIILKWMYPIIVKLNKKSPMGILKENTNSVQANHSFYTLQQMKNEGTVLDFKDFKGKKVLIVNTASNCGYTNQFRSLQNVYETSKNNLVVLGFPSNDFKEQEKGSDQSIQQFCQINFGVSFPVMKKSVVLKQKDQNTVFQWLTDAAQNGWNNEAPVWNFNKYLINEEGQLTHIFGPAIDPAHPEFKKALGY